MTITRKKTTIYVDPTLLRAAKVFAASTGRHEYEILEDALRQYLSQVTRETSRQELRDLLNRSAERADINDEQALNLAYTELRAARRSRNLE